MVLEQHPAAAGGDVLFAATRRGEVWRIADVDGAPQPTLWAEGLHEPLGLLAHDGWLYAAQRGELSRMKDADGDGRMDTLETVASGWPLSGNYHEYAFGPARAADGSFWITLNKPFGDEPFGRATFRGWAIRVPPEGGSWEPVCAGLRSPAGVGTAPDGTIWYTDNQGEWCATCKFTPLEVGDFHGHPWGIESCKLPESKVPYPGDVHDKTSFEECERTLRGFRQPAVWIPYDVCGRSAAGFVWDTAGNFPPFQGQVFCGDQYSSEVFRMSLEKVGGRWQGACYPFRRGLKCGITRVLWGRQGTLWCGLTNRGWGSLGQAEHGLQRLVWKGETPFELQEVTATAKGFRIAFTQPISAISSVPPAFTVRSWTYELHERYGCDPMDVREHTLSASALEADGAAVQLEVDGLQPLRVYEIRCDGVLSADGGAQVLHPIAWYTRNREPQ